MFETNLNENSKSRDPTRNRFSEIQKIYMERKTRSLSKEKSEEHRKWRFEVKMRNRFSFLKIY